MPYSMYSFLRAPCVFCGYNGPNYYQEKSHHETCPFHNVGGVEERREVLLDISRVVGAALRRDHRVIPIDRIKKVYDKKEEEQKHNPYKVEFFDCECVDQECDCNPWVVIGPDDNWYDTFLRKEDADGTANLLNMAN